MARASLRLTMLNSQVPVNITVALRLLIILNMFACRQQKYFSAE
jgi:hypothetical protein